MTTTKASKDVFEFVIKSLVKKDVQTRINSTIGVGQEVKTRFQVVNFYKLQVCFCKKEHQKMHNVSRQPAQCKRQDHDYKHAQNFPLWCLTLSFLMRSCFAGNLVQPEAAPNEYIQSCYDSQGDQIEHNKRGHEIGPGNQDSRLAVVGQVSPNHFANPSVSCFIRNTVKQNKIQRAVQWRHDPDDRRHQFGVANNWHMRKRMKDGEIAIQRDKHERNDGGSDRKNTSKIDKLARDNAKTTRQPGLFQVQELHLQISSSSILIHVFWWYYFKVEFPSLVRNSSFT